MKSFNDWSKLKKLKDFNKRLASYEWGAIDKDLNPLPDDEFEKYHTISPKTLHKLKRGTCWDYVEAQRDWYEEEGVQHKVYYIEADNPEKASHTFLIAQIGEQFLWDEASWKPNKGVHLASSAEKLLNIVCKKHSKTSENISKISVYCYPKPKKFGMSVKEFMSWVKRNGKHVLTWNKE